MTAPWYIYLVSLIIALPIFFLVAVFAFGLLRGLFVWAFSSEGQSGPRIHKRAVSK